MAISIINVGVVANDGNGDSIRDAFIKVNDNDADLDGRVATNVSDIATNTANITANTAAFNAKNAKDGVKSATTVNITLSGAQTIDDISVIAGDRVFVKNQTTASENGIYIVATGAWTRSTDANTSAKVISGLRVTVLEGIANGNTGWHLTTAGTIILDSTGLTFEQFANVLAAADFPTFSGALVSLTADVSVPATTTVFVAFNNEVEDTDGFHDNVTNNTRLTVPVNGRYVITANVSVTSNAQHNVWIFKNGVKFIGMPCETDGNLFSLTAYPLTATAGDFFELRFENVAGSSISIHTDNAANGITSFGIYRIE